MSTRDITQGGERRDSAPRLAHVDFESSLAERIEVPEERADEFLSWSDHELSVQTRSTANILRRFARVVGLAMENPDAPAEFVEKLDLKTISRDHDWREVFRGIQRELDDRREDANMAVRRYLHYLSARKDLLDAVCAKRSALEETDEHTLTLSVLRAAQRIHPGLERLTLGEPTDIEIPYRGELAIMLGRHAFKLLDGCPPRLQNPRGANHPLARGRQLVGRHPESDIRVHHDFHDVSRAHMVIEWDGETRIRITDLSTRGTYVLPPEEDSERTGPFGRRHSTGSTERPTQRRTERSAVSASDRLLLGSVKPR